MVASITSRVFSNMLLIAFIILAMLFGFYPASADDYSSRQIALNMKQENSAQSLQDKLLKQAQEARLLYTVGNRELDSKDYDNAIASYQKAMSLDPSFAPIHYNLAMAHIAIGHKKEAAQYLRTFIKLRPNAFNADEVHDLIKLLSK
jgi:tetratricopeptide (TPR) repeat protein